MEQDHFYAMLIQEGLTAKRERERIEEKRKAAQTRHRR